MEGWCYSSEQSSTFSLAYLVFTCRMWTHRDTPLLHSLRKPNLRSDLDKSGSSHGQGMLDFNEFLEIMTDTWMQKNSSNRSSKLEGTHFLILKLGLLQGQDERKGFQGWHALRVWGCLQERQNMKFNAYAHDQYSDQQVLFDVPSHGSVNECKVPAFHFYL